MIEFLAYAGIGLAGFFGVIFIIVVAESLSNK
jgi:hypothetical protein